MDCRIGYRALLGVNTRPYSASKYGCEKKAWLVPSSLRTAGDRGWHSACQVHMRAGLERARAPPRPPHQTKMIHKNFTSS